jgi:homoserine kinase
LPAGLSGSGSSVCCVAPAGAAMDVGKAMMSVFQQNHLNARLFKLRADNQGLKVVPVPRV